MKNKSKFFCVIGNGQLAQIFDEDKLDNTVVFASGVANSNCIDEKEFQREKDLLLKNLEEHQEKKFVYFSSCALSAPGYPKNAYYRHKQNMEELIAKKHSDFYIFRIPQLFGNLKKHQTLLNFIYTSIMEDKEFIVYDDAYRYVIEINDVRVLVEAYLKYHTSNCIVDLANDYRYKVEEIVNILEDLTSKKAHYALVSKSDKYMLDLEKLKVFVSEHHIPIDFGKEYLYLKLQAQTV